MSLILFVFILSSDDYDEKESVGVCMLSVCMISTRQVMAALEADRQAMEKQFTIVQVSF